MRHVFVSMLLFPTLAFADGGADEPPSNPVMKCTGSQVFDPTSRECVDPENGALDPAELYEAVRQLAYAGRYVDAQAVLNALPQDDPGRLTYMGFTHRKLGNRDLAMDFYQQAIALDPANHQARSYMGQGLVAEGDLSGALHQLNEITKNGGAGTWSERSLRIAIATGTTYNY